MSTTPEQLRLAADIIEKDLPWEYSEDKSPWASSIFKVGVYVRKLLEGDDICLRIKPASFPPLPENCVWHNPDGLTAEQVGDGYRLAVVYEIGKFSTDGHFKEFIHQWDSPRKVWDETGWAGNAEDFTYRIPISTPFPDGSYLKDGQLVTPWKPKFKIGDRVQIRQGGLGEHVQKRGVVGLISENLQAYQFENGMVWHKEYDLDPQPWYLSRHIPGFRPLRDGEEWHSCGSHPWIETDLEDGWRPCLVGEKPKVGDVYWLGGDGPFVEVDCDWEKPLKRGLTCAKTRRPLPEPKLVPLGMNDWMKDGPWWVRSNGEDTCPSMVVSVNVHKVFYGRYGENEHEEAMRLQRSNDGITWTPCYREEPA